jgi:hypothetical protein
MHRSASTRRHAVGLLGAVTAFVLWSTPTQAQIPDTFTNLEVLPKDISKVDLVALMRGFALGLGVRCEHCHKGEGNDLSKFEFADDEKIAKKKARAMIEMVQAINGKHLAALPERSSPAIVVTCKTCHRGQPRPRALEDVLADELTKGGVPAAIAKYHDLKRRFLETGSFDFHERSLNTLAQRIWQPRLPDALDLLKLNASEHPQSVPTHVLLAEAYFDSGDRTSALKTFRHVLEMDATNEQARKRLAELGG